MKRPSLKRFFPIFSILFFVSLAIIAVFILFPRAEPSDERKLGRVITECPFGHDTIRIQRIFYAEDLPLTPEQENLVKMGAGFDQHYSTDAFVAPSQYLVVCETCGCRYFPARQRWDRELRRSLIEIRSKDHFPELSWMIRELASVDEQTTRSVILYQSFLERSPISEDILYSKKFSHITDRQAFQTQLSNLFSSHSLISFHIANPESSSYTNYHFTTTDSLEVEVGLSEGITALIIISVKYIDAQSSHTALMAASQANPAYLVYKPPLKYHIAKAKGWIKNTFAKFWP